MVFNLFFFAFDRVSYVNNNKYIIKVIIKKKKQEKKDTLHSVLHLPVRDRKTAGNNDL